MAEDTSAQVGYYHHGLDVSWSCRYGQYRYVCEHEDCISWERAEMVRLRKRVEELEGQLDQAYCDGWADGEQFVMDNLAEYVLLRFRLGAWLWRNYTRLARKVREARGEQRPVTTVQDWDWEQRTAAQDEATE